MKPIVIGLNAVGNPTQSEVPPPLPLIETPALSARDRLIRLVMKTVNFNTIDFLKKEKQLLELIKYEERARVPKENGLTPAPLFRNK